MFFFWGGGGVPLRVFRRGGEHLGLHRKQRAVAGSFSVPYLLSPLVVCVFCVLGGIESAAGSDEEVWWVLVCEEQNRVDGSCGGHVSICALW